MSSTTINTTALEMKLTQCAYKSFWKKSIEIVKRKCEPKKIGSTANVGVVQVLMESIVNHPITKIMEKPYAIERHKMPSICTYFVLDKYR